MQVRQVALVQSGHEPTTHYQQHKQKRGGTPAADARAQADAWAATWRFLADALSAPEHP